MLAIKYLSRLGKRTILMASLLMVTWQVRARGGARGLLGRTDFFFLFTRIINKFEFIRAQTQSSVTRTYTLPISALRPKLALVPSASPL